MIEPILLEEQTHAQKKPQGASKSNWIMFILFSIILAGAAVAVVLTIDGKSTDADTNESPPVLTSPNAAEICDACTLVPSMEDHVMCKSCSWHKQDSKSLVCPSGYGDLTLSDVQVGGKANSAALAAIQNECTAQYADYFEDSGEPFACTFTLNSLLPTSSEAPVSSDEPLLAKHGHHSNPDKAKAKFICSKNVEVETYDEIPALRLRSPSPVVDNPFLSSVQVKCDGRKLIAETVEKIKICAVTADSSITFSCPSGTDPRVIVQKMKQEASTPSDTRADKQRAKLITNYCAAGNLVDGVCTVPPEELLFDTETELADKVWDVKYFCSYASVTSPTLQNTLITLASSASEEPGEPLLSSALVKCGKRKEYSSTVEVAKTCSDVDFELDCNPDADPRIIVLSMWAGKHGDKAAKERANSATNFCTHNLVDGKCVFSLSDLGVDPEPSTTEPDVLVDSTMGVKYMCSYGSPVFGSE